MSRGAGGGRDPGIGVGGSAKASILPFLAARIVVLGVLEACRLAVNPFHLLKSSREVGTVHAGLLAWDASYYQRIAESGYSGAGRSALRFFPLFPLAGRYLGAVPGVSDGVALIVLANVAAFASLVVLHQLVSMEALGKETAAASIWFLALWPAAFVLVMGYAEGLFLLLSIFAFWCWRTGRWWLSILPAYLAGLTRPVGVLLAAPALVEAFLVFRRETRGGHDASWISTQISRLLAIGAAPVGAATYLLWVDARYGSLTLPLSEQLSGRHRGSLSDPVITFASEVSDGLHGHHLGEAMHAPFVVIFILLTVYVCLRLPAAYGWYAVATMAVALTAANLDSFERYGLACFPLAIGAACAFASRPARLAALCASAAALVVLSGLAFVGIYVP